MTSTLRARETAGSAQQVTGGYMTKSNTAGRWTSSNSASGPRASQITYAGLISLLSPTSHQNLTSVIILECFEKLSPNSQCNKIM